MPNIEKTKAHHQLIHLAKKKAIGRALSYLLTNRELAKV
jgi:hypothetical protein